MTDFTVCRHGNVIYSISVVPKTIPAGDVDKNRLWEIDKLLKCISNDGKGGEVKKADLQCLRGERCHSRKACAESAVEKSV